MGSRRRAVLAAAPPERASSGRARPAPPPRKPMAIARRVSLFERTVDVRLAPAAIELLHGAARVLTEGALAGEAYAGSTMLTVDLAHTVDRVSDPPDAAT